MNPLAESSQNSVGSNIILNIIIILLIVLAAQTLHIERDRNSNFISACFDSLVSDIMDKSNLLGV